jgi:hypothetical protein
MVFVVDLENCRACVNKFEINAETLLIDCL